MTADASPPSDENSAIPAGWDAPTAQSTAASTDVAAMPAADQATLVPPHWQSITARGTSRDWEPGNSDQLLQLATWLVEPGELVRRGESLGEVMLPGLVIDVTAGCDGEVMRLAATPGRTVRWSDVLGWIEPTAGAEGCDGKSSRKPGGSQNSAHSEDSA
jgi:biotin carboxyl carrier protein